jgi:tetratricopeptide (TPR) repeat protein
VTEQARLELAKGDANTALRDLGRAVSIDPGNPFAYYYLGRTYLTRNDYAQAETFFQRAELGFTGRPDWLGETMSYVGACDEQLGRSSDAAKAYQRAVTLAPGNFRAVAGNSRLGGSTGPVGGLDAPPPPDQSAEAPPAESLPPPAPDEPEAPAPDSN